ncbi:hypothetical protein ACTXT7_009240 [Hymenolepis weldensis]
MATMSSQFGFPNGRFWKQEFGPVKLRTYFLYAWDKSGKKWCVQPIRVQLDYNSNPPALAPPNSKSDERGIIETNCKGISMRLALIMPTSIHKLVKSTKEIIILGRGSALYFSKERSLGKVYEVIANVFSPIYVIVHNNLNFKPEESYQYLFKIHCYKVEEVFSLSKEEPNAALLLAQGVEFKKNT